MADSHNDHLDRLTFCRPTRYSPALGTLVTASWDEPPHCPYCDRVMSNREHDEQGACNDCNGGPCVIESYGEIRDGEIVWRRTAREETAG